MGCRSEQSHSHGLRDRVHITIAVMARDMAAMEAVMRGGHGRGRSGRSWEISPTKDVAGVAAAVRRPSANDGNWLWAPGIHTRRRLVPEPPRDGTRAAS